MGVFNVFIVSKSGGLIYHHDHNLTTQEVEKTFGFPLDIKLQTDPNRVFVMFGQRDGIAVGHSLRAVNGIPVSQNNPRLLDDGREVGSGCALLIQLTIFNNLRHYMYSLGTMTHDPLLFLSFRL